MAKRKPPQFASIRKKSVRNVFIVSLLSGIILGSTFGYFLLPLIIPKAQSRVIYQMSDECRLIINETSPTFLGVVFNEKYKNYNGIYNDQMENKLFYIN